MGLLLTYQDRSQSVVGQWHWGYRINKISLPENEFAFICYRPEQCETFAPDVEIRVSTKKTVSRTKGWRYQPLLGQIFWFFCVDGDYLYFG